MTVELKSSTGLSMSRRMASVPRGSRTRRSIGAFMTPFPSPAYDGRTYQTVVVAEAPYVGVRVIIRNNGPAYTLNDLAVAPSANAPPGRNPSGGAGSWVRCTLAGANGPWTIPAALATNRPSYTVFDLVDMTSLARTDGDTLPLLFARAYYATGPASGYANTTNPVPSGHTTEWPGTSSGSTTTVTSYNRGRIIQADSAAGNFVTSNQGGFTANDAYSTIIGEFEFLHARNALTVMALGDSITQGDTSSANMLSPLHIACANVSTPSRPVCCMNYGFSSQKSTNFRERLQDAITAGVKPGVVVYSAWTPNEWTTQTGLWVTEMALMRKNLALIIDLCNANNIALVVSTGIPKNGLNTTYDAIRIGYNNEIRALANQGISVVDYDAVMTDGATPANLIAAYTSDNTHPNDAGYELMGAALTPIIQAMSDAYFA